MLKQFDQGYDRFLNASKLLNSTSLFHYFLCCVGIINFYIYYLAYTFYSELTQFHIWFILSLLFIFTNISFSIFCQRKNVLSASQQRLWSDLSGLTTGVLFATGLSLLYYYLPALTVNLKLFEAITIGFTLSFVSILCATVFLSRRPTSFLLYCLPALSPYLIIQFYILPNTFLNFFATANFSLMLVLATALLCILLQRHLTKIHLNNKQVFQITENQLESTKEQNIHLNNKMKNTEEKTKELYEYSLSLEETLENRSLSLAQIHQDLKNKQTNLVLAHEIAGLIPWNWNIAERKISFTDKLNNTTFKDADLHRAKLMNLIHPEDVVQFKKMLRLHLRGLTERFEATYRIKGIDGLWFWVHDIGRVIERDPQTHLPLYMVGIRRDIQQERQAQERLKLTATAIEQAAEGFIILDQDFRYVSVNPYFEKMFGRQKKHILGKHIFDLSAKRKIQHQLAHEKILEEVKETGHAEGEITETLISGHKVVLRYNINIVKDEANKTINYIGIIADISEQKRQEQKLSYLQNYDALTDLPNRLYYNYQLHQHLISQKDSIQKLAIIRLNIDRFRPLNDYLSNKGGDEILRQVAQRLRLTATEAFIVAHLNGDNFAIVYEISHIRPSIEEQCKKISTALLSPFTVNDEEFNLTVSMGVSIYPDHGRQVDYLDNCAEQALLEAKRLGGNSTKIYNLEKNEILEQNIILERELHNALKNDEFEIYFQPKVKFSDQKIHGFEALIRWNHPSKGMISPNIFIPLAEQTSLITEIGAQVIHKTAEQIQKWQAQGYSQLSVSFNVAAQQLHRGNLIEILDEVIEKYQISGEHLELELTESSLLENSDVVKQTLEELRQRNIYIALDDFGTGYSSLSYLTDFPIDTLKIDRSFVNRIGQPKQEAIIGAIVAMGKAMGMSIVAEGIENIEQLKYLHDLDCDLAQGYFFSKPLPEADATRFLQMQFHQSVITI